MNADIISGIKNAVEHGSTLQEAVQSFLNAGYSATEVEEAARYLTGGATTAVNPSAHVPGVSKEVESPKAPIAVPAQQTRAQTQQPVNSMNNQRPVQQNQLRPNGQRPLGGPAQYPVINRPAQQFQPKPLPQSNTSGIGSSSTANPYQQSRALQNNTAKIVTIYFIAALLMALIIVGIVFRQELIDILSSLLS